MNGAGRRVARLRRWARQLAADVPTGRLRRRVEELPGPRNRMHSPGPMDAAERLLQAWFTDAGAAVHRQPFTVTDVAGYRDHEPFDKVRYDRLSGVNLVATLPGRGTGATVLLAHYDTVRDSPGADDNTASVVALVEVARLLATLELAQTIVLAATDLEEPGFFGAYALVDRLAAEHRLRLAVNFESIAYTCTRPGSQRLPKGLGLLYPRQVARIRRRELRADFTVLIHNGPARRPAALLGQVLTGLCPQPEPVTLRDPNGLPVLGTVVRRRVRAARHFRRSDHVAFWDRGVPAVQVTDTADLRYAHYHRAGDTADRLDYERVRDIIAATTATVAHLAGYRP